MKRACVFVAIAAAGGCGDNQPAPVGQPDATVLIQDAAVDAPAMSALAALPLTTPDGSYYNAPLTIGTQTFLVDVDTGSTSTAVAGMTCTQCTGISPLYAPGGTAVDQMRMASTAYADGSRWKGEIFTDDMGFGHGTPTVNVAFVGITSQHTFFDPANTDQGILGLGPSELLEDGTTSIVDALAAAHETPTFAFEMCPTEGTMWVGGFDATKASAPMQYAPMLPIDAQHNPFYAVDLQDVGMGGTSLGFGSAMLGQPIVDTGTSLTYLPLAVVNAMLGKANAAAGYATVLAAPLSQTAGPNQDGCVAAVGGATAAMVDAVLPPMALTLPAGTGTDTFTLSVPATQSYLYDGGDGTFCLAIFDDGGFGSLLGDATMRAFITVFDIATHRIGLAPDAGCATSAKRPARRRIVEHGHRPHRR